jgi:hypothetical protein
VPHAVEGCPQPASKHEEHEAHKHEGPISYSVYCPTNLNYKHQ